MHRLALLAVASVLTSSSVAAPTITCDDRGCVRTLQESPGNDLFTPYNWGAHEDVPVVQVHKRVHVRKRPVQHFAKNHATSLLSDLIAPLATKVQEILDVCHAHMVSGYRPGARVAGSGHASLHSAYPSKAADLTGNPACIYSHLHSWSGGYSIDYGRVRHVHVSYSPPGSGYLAGREWHARFNHYGGGHHRTLTAHRRHHRLAGV